tara:strand:+ start:20156 stop:20878 length:723 start_codon:yes stop_codon:yes gene_type:complete
VRGADEPESRGPDASGAAASGSAASGSAASGSAASGADEPESPLARLRQGHALRDEQFDAIYPAHIQNLSERFWTPLAVAKDAAAFLASSPGARVLDAGSGVGKFCIVGSCTTSGAFTGLEQRADLVELARTTAQPLNKPPTFHHANLIDHDWSAYQSIYLYNPFFELTSGPWCQIDASIGYNKSAQASYIRTVTHKLQALQSGTRIATYFGFGGTMPTSYSLTKSIANHPGPLEFWIKD